jgi:hypothetical protein
MLASKSRPRIKPAVWPCSMPSSRSPSLLYNSHVPRITHRPHSLPRRFIRPLTPSSLWDNSPPLALILRLEAKPVSHTEPATDNHCFVTHHSCACVCADYSCTLSDLHRVCLEQSGESRIDAKNRIYEDRLAGRLPFLDSKG